jgi:hypothetical protein
LRVANGQRKKQKKDLTQRAQREAAEDAESERRSLRARRKGNEEQGRIRKAETERERSATEK